MAFHQAGGVRYFTFEKLSQSGVTHAVFTRQGGVSAAPYDSLNVGSTVGDEMPSVRQNLQRSFAALGLTPESMFDSWLVHGREVHVAHAPRPADWAKPPKADIVITDHPEVTLFMRYADCVPILLFDPQRKAVALAHAGWRGTVARTSEAAVAALAQHYGSRPQDLIAAIGPCISAARYPVGPEVVAEVQAAFAARAGDLLPRYGEATHFDLQAANQIVLQQAGVENIEVADLCTASNMDHWFSHRGSGGRTGRFGALITLCA
ncbi:MAG: peptidoglycan editing factor PgeF [Anaerolineales bacterium]|nr:peptidoglycan editing factor PgeF [Anaerolineales bacterium]